MANKRWSVKCDLCEEKTTFEDSTDLRFNKWVIVAWIVPSGEPMAICPKCASKDTEDKPKKKKEK